MPATGDRVRIHYTGRLPDGTTFDSSEGREPLEFTVGSGEIIPGLDRAVASMAEGESETVTVPASEGYGDYQEGLAQSVEREKLPDGTTEGMALRADVNGQETILWVTEIGDTTAVVDPNHPLAGKDLIFEIDLVSVIAA